MRRIVKDVLIVLIGIAVIWGSIQIIFGTGNPFYVVVSGSMVPELQIYDVLVVQGNAPFEEVGIGDIIVFLRPSDHDRIIVHRVVSITDDDPRTLRTKGDANSGSISGTDYPITAEEYKGTVAYVVPQIGFVMQMLKPPVNYIIIVVVVGALVAKQILKNRKSQLPGSTEQQDDNSQDGPEREEKNVRTDSFDMPDRDGDSEYSKHVRKKPDDDTDGK